MGDADRDLQGDRLIWVMARGSGEGSMHDVGWPVLIRSYCMAP